MRAFIILGLLVVATAASWACVVDSGCFFDTDCEAPEVCFTDGVCRLECDELSTEFCSTAEPYCLLPGNRCVECLGDEQCEGETEACVNNACVPLLAPGFTLADQNPTSPTYGEDLALSDFQGQVVLLYFAGLG